MLKESLLRDVCYLCRRTDRLWSEPIIRTLRELRNAEGKSVFFGGTLRSLLISRLINGNLGRPRDIDVVVAQTTIETLRDRFHEIVSRETRFGGLQLRRERWHFDVWPLSRTLAFIEDGVDAPAFEDLPATTFFNLEAVAVEVWPSLGKPRIIYSADDQFFTGILTRTLEINRESNPFPSLCITRALVMASAINLRIGRKLALYLVDQSAHVTNNELEEVQLKHYGRIRLYPETMRKWVDHIKREVEKREPSTIKLPIPRQRSLFPDDRIWPMFHTLKQLVSSDNKDCIESDGE